jgi:transcription elongation factor Elf1
MPRASCPKCGEAVSMVTMSDVELLNQRTGQTLQGVRYSCLSCGCLFGVQMNSVELKAELVREILDAITKSTSSKPGA